MKIMHKRMQNIKVKSMLETRCVNNNLPLFSCSIISVSMKNVKYINILYKIFYEIVIGKRELFENTRRRTRIFIIFLCRFLMKEVLGLGIPIG
jgi:hypothetical protein